MESNYKGYLLIHNIQKNKNVGMIIRSAAAHNINTVFTVIKDEEKKKRKTPDSYVILKRNQSRGFGSSCHVGNPGRSGADPGEEVILEMQVERLVFERCMRLCDTLICASFTCLTFFYEIMCNVRDAF